MFFPGWRSTLLNKFFYQNSPNAKYVRAVCLQSLIFLAEKSAVWTDDLTGHEGCLLPCQKQ